MSGTPAGKTTVPSFSQTLNLGAVGPIVFVGTTPVDPAPYSNSQTVIDTSTGDVYEVQNFSYGSPIYHLAWVVADSVGNPQYSIFNNEQVLFEGTGMMGITFPGGSKISFDVPADLSLFDNGTSMFITLADVPAEVNPNVPDAPNTPSAGNYMLNWDGGATWTWTIAGAIEVGDFLNTIGYITAADEADPVFTAWLAGQGAFADAMDQGVATGDDVTFNNVTVNGKLTVLGEIDPTAIDFEQVATPAAPVAGHQKIYFKTDRLPYSLDQDSVERQIAFIDQVAALPIDVVDITGLATVATSGDYNDLSNLPDLSGYITEAPNDGQLYARRSLAWEAFDPNFTEVNPNVPDSPMVGAGFFMLHDNGSSAWDWTISTSIGLSSFADDLYDQTLNTGDPVSFSSVDAPIVYTPADGSNWVDPDPTTVQEAIDRIAAVLGLSGATPIP